MLISWVFMSYTSTKLKQIWSKGKTVSGYDSDLNRKDACDAWMTFSDFGKTESWYGWEVDHIKPKAQGGSNDLSNLRPLQWENNREKAAGRTKCVITSSENKNVRVER